MKPSRNSLAKSASQAHPGDMVIIVFAVLVLLASIFGHDSRDGLDWKWVVPPR